MSTAVLLGVAATLLGTALLTVGAVGLARANPDERIPHRRNEGWWRYQVFYGAGLLAAVAGTVALQGELGVLVVVPVLVVVLGPHLVLNEVHRRRVVRRTGG